MITKPVYKCFIISLLLLIYAPVYASFFEERAEGWHWYQNPKFDSFKENKERSQKILPQAPVLMTPTEIVKAYQKTLEEKLHHAWVSPTPKNIQTYQEMQKDLMQRSQQFSETWMQGMPSVKLRNF